MNRVGVALGSNLGERLANLREARDLLVGLGVDGGEFLQASVYASVPLDCPEGSPDFLNTVVEFEFEGTAWELLRETQGIERELGRKIALEVNAPRVIDVDLLYFGNEVIDEARLVVPHPRMRERSFVMEPLCEIRPELVLAGDRELISVQFGRMEETPLRVVASDW